MLEYKVEENYVGAGNLAQYSFDFKIADLSQLLILITRPDLTRFCYVRGTDTTFLSSVVFDPRKGGGLVTLAANLAVDYELKIIYANDAPSQPAEFGDKADFKLRNFERALDFITGAIQRASYLSRRALRVADNLAEGEFNTELPFYSTDPMVEDNVDRVFVVGADNKSFAKGPTVKSLDSAVIATAVSAAEAAEAAAEAALQAQIAAEAAAAASLAGLPTGGVLGDYVEKLTAVDNDANWLSGTFTGFSSRFNISWNTVGLRNTLLAILNFVYQAPTISLAASGNGTIREKGASVASTTLTATVTKKSDPIAAVRFYQGATLLDTKTGTIPGGGTETTVYSTPFTDNIGFTAQVDDNGATGGPSTVTASANFTFVYPYYRGAGAVGLTGAQIASLTKEVIQSTATLTRSITATAGQVLYFAYPAAYGLLVSIKDVNNFETIGDWTQTSKSITGLDGTPQTYYCYEFNNPVGAGSYQYTFSRV